MKQYIEKRIIDLAYASFPHYVSEPPHELDNNLGINYNGFKNEVLKIAFFPKNKTERFFSWYLLTFKSDLIKTYYKETLEIDTATFNLFGDFGAMFLYKINDFIEEFKRCAKIDTFNHYGVLYYNINISQYFFDDYKLYCQQGNEKHRIYGIYIRNLSINSKYGQEIRELKRKIALMTKLMNERGFNETVNNLLNSDVDIKKSIGKIKPILELYPQVIEHIKSLHINSRF
jgi:hypothetical protein